MPADPSPPASKVVLNVERYRVYGQFAAGGMATVHFARLLGAQGFRRTVAVKRLLSHRSSEPDFAVQLVEEARLAARVRHPNVVSTLDTVQSGDELLLVMDYVHGESLAALSRAARARGEGVPRAIALAIVIDLLHGLHAAHEAKDERGLTLGLVHRDVSPQNVLVGLDGITRIADFGIAKAATQAHSTRDGIVKGKLAYMAPEQLDGERVSPRSDLFAASVVLWELLSEAPLFSGKSQAETVFKLLSAPIPKPSSRAALSPGLEAIVMRGLSRDPEQRFGSAREMALALESEAPSVRPSELAAWVEQMAGQQLAQRAAILRAIEQDESGSDRPLAPASRPRRNKLVRPAAVLVLIALPVLVWLVARRPLPPTPLRSASQTPASAARPAPPPAAAQLSPTIEQIGEARRHAETASDHVEPKEKRARARVETRPRRCDPPYTFDAVGRKIFKAECM